MASLKIYIHNRVAPHAFTLIEVVIVISLFLAVAAMGLFVSMDEYRGYHFRSERDVIVSVLQKARSQSMANLCNGTTCMEGTPHGVSFVRPGEYVLFEGTSYALRNVDADESITARDAATYLSGTDEVVFAPYSGNGPDVSATLIVTDSSGKHSTITVEPTGRIWWSN